jgi:hypothetical protein
MASMSWLRPFARAPRRVVLLTALAVGVAACDSGPSDPDVPPVATLVVAGTPSEALRAGETVQLMASTLSSSGSVINGAPVVWKSSDETVAMVSSSGLVTARAAGQVTVTATSGGGSASVEISVVAPLSIDLSGGTFTVPDGRLSLSIPSGFGSGTTTLLVGPGASSLADDLVVPGTIFQVIAAPTPNWQISGSTLTMRYDPARLPAASTAGGLQLYTWTGSGWAVVRGSASDPARSVVSGTYFGPATFAVRVTPVARVALTGAQLDGALYVGQTTTLHAAPVTSVGDTLIGHTTTWSSSVTSVASVNAQGAVTAVGIGTTTITATIAGVSVSTQLQVLDRPVASWPAGAEWSTFRGNNRRTGHVDATLDPVTFTRRWEVTLSATGLLNEPATGDGNVYVSSSAYFSSQALWALDAATGTIRWTRAFGGINSVNGPATGNGRVYVSTGGHNDSFLWSLDATDGTVRFRSPYGNQWSRWFAPAVTEDIVFLGGGYYGGVSAFDALEGMVLWRRDLPQQDGWTPAADAGRVYLFGYEGARLGLLSMDGRSGAATLELPELGLPPAGTPVLGGGDDVYAIGGGRLLAMDLAHDVLAWERPGAYQGVPALDAANVYAVVDGQVEARRRLDGALVWTWVPQPELAATGSVIVTRNLLFVRLAPSGPTTKVNQVVALDLATRKVVWGYDAGGEIALGSGLLLITDHDLARVTAIAVR